MRDFLQGALAVAVRFLMSVLLASADFVERNHMVIAVVNRISGSLFGTSHAETNFSF